MRDFQKDRRNRGGRDFKRRDFDRPQQMFKTICSNCGKECEVPFKPSGAKPVYCRECFQNNRNSNDLRSDNFPRRTNFQDGGNRESRATQTPQYNGQFEALNIKLDKILNLLTVEKQVIAEEPAEIVQTPKASKPPVIKKRTVKKPL